MKKKGLICSILGIMVACKSTPPPEEAKTLPDSSQAETKVVEAPSESTQEEKEQKLQEAIQIALNTIYFDFDSFDIKEDAKPSLENLANSMKMITTSQIQIEGHADTRGSNEYNLSLSEKRAHAIKQYLTALGVSSEQVLTTGYGEQQLASDGQNEDAHAQNRRCEFKRIR